MEALNFLKLTLKSLGLREVVFKFVRAYANFFPNQTIRRNGINYAVDLKQLVDFSIFIGGWEPSTIGFLNRSVKHGDLVIEVGANVGAHTLLIAKLAGPRGHVYAFEPTEFALNKLKKNISLNPDLLNITTRTELVTNKKSDLPKVDIRSSWSVDEKSPVELMAIQNPKPISIDDFASSIELDRLTLLKVDVDGYDYKVLEGAKSTIKRFRPVIFCELCEYTLNEQGDSVRKIFDMLLSMGYEAYLEDEASICQVDSVLELIGLTTSVNGIFVHTAAKRCN